MQYADQSSTLFGVWHDVAMLGVVVASAIVHHAVIRIVVAVSAIKQSRYCVLRACYTPAGHW